MSWISRNGFFGDKFSKRKSVHIAGYFLVLMILVALFASVLSNEKPLYVQYQGENLFPALSLKGYAEVYNETSQRYERLAYSTVDWQVLEKEKVVWCPVAFSAGKSNWSHPGYAPPLDTPGFDRNGNDSTSAWRNRHWLGTTKTGADVLSGIIHGTKISLTIGVFSMMIAGIIGIVLGAAAGFFGDHRIRVSQSGLFSAVLLGLPLSYFYGLYLNPYSLSEISSSSYVIIIAFLLRLTVIVSLLMTSLYFLGKYLGHMVHSGKRVFLEVDQIVSRMIEIFNSIPRIVLIITISAISRPSVLNLVLIIGLTSWTEIARLVRAEMLRVRESDYIQSAEASGIKTIRQIFRHALPNVILPALTAITLGVASAILTESALSFLGVGVPANVVTWGSLLNEGRQNFSAWWLVVFPGLAIFSTVLAINILGDALGESLDPRSKPSSHV